MKSGLITQALIALLLLCACEAYSQSIIGTWQLGTSQVGSGYRECYVFKSDKSFEYKVNSDDGLQRVRSIGGTYSFKEGSLVLNIRYTYETFGGHVQRSHINTGSDSWTIEGGTLKKVNLPKPSTEDIDVEFLDKSIVLFDGMYKYFKVK